ncbi:MAG: hypothetical protein ACKOFW_06285, partial [Planctomycetaceae bacterium]
MTARSVARGKAPTLTKGRRAANALTPTSVAACRGNPVDPAARAAPLTPLPSDSDRASQPARVAATSGRIALRAAGW